MKYTLIAAISAVSLLAAGCSKKNDGDADDAAVATATASDGAAISSSVANPSQTFVDAAASSDGFEIESSKLAATKAEFAKVKSFAEQMIKAHTGSTEKLKAAAAAASPALTPNPVLAPVQQAKLTELAGKSRADFDKDYAAAQVDAHQATLSALKAYSANGDVPSLKAFATSLIPTVNEHLTMAKGL